MWSVSPWGSSFGSSSLHRSIHRGQRFARGHPFYSPIGLGTSPVSTNLSFSSSGDSGGIADKSAWVYGCRGLW